MSETTTQRTARLLAMSNAQLIMHAQDLTKQRDELLAALEQMVTWGRMQHKAQSKGGHATFDMMSLRDEIDLAELAIASVKGGAE